ncbi:hypothetical protein PLESTB_000205100 [Pleodorina starrii]|uniref:tRNA(His) guanylyltransferase n=1 Tax=Pleodorina starrii TaxID=330485 RepID=A0A9W6BBY4_9CHLO|nr:hypothetical protein PLESTB_000205100 [Pleodorina starrii]
MPLPLVLTLESHACSYRHAHIAYRAVASLGLNTRGTGFLSNKTAGSSSLPCVLPQRPAPGPAASTRPYPHRYLCRCSYPNEQPASTASAAHTPTHLADKPSSEKTVGGAAPVFDHPAAPYDAASSRARRARRGGMANSKYEYVKQYELDDTLLPGCWIVIRIDGKGFTKFSDLHGFEKPNDKRALDLMDECARVMNEFPDIRLAYGESDEYSFVLARNTDMYGRRASKLVSLLVSCFTANYVTRWPAHLPDTPLRATPMFDGRAVCYPLDSNLRDYLAWRQADTHINNQYNTCFWALVKSGKTSSEAQATLRGTQAAFKNELLFRDFGINYAHLPEQFKKGSVVVRQKALVEVKRREDGSPVMRERALPTVLHVDIIRDEFWKANPHLLAH